MDASQKVTHVLNRLSLGARPGDRAQVQQSGVENYIQAQLNPADLPEPAALSARIKELSTVGLSPLALFEQYAMPENPSEEKRKAIDDGRNQIYQEAIQARLLRAVESPRQLQEVLVDFWFNHFNVYESQEFTRIWTGEYEHSAIRPHVLGKFGDLLQATARHPAMLSYLDNWENTAPGSRGATGPFQGLNENYARELLELHTLGVGGGYSQSDVESLARILTGWSVVHPQQRDVDKSRYDQSGFLFVGDRHDASDKVLLGQRIAGGGPEGGIEEGEAALDLLARHPATAQHISYQLAQHFVADAPPAPLVSRLAERFLSTDGDIKAVLSALFESDEFWDDAYYQRKFRTPYQYPIAMARAAGLTPPSPDNLTRLDGLIAQLGMPMYRCQTPNGYSQTEASWLNPEAMVRRVSFAISTVDIRPNEKPDPKILLEAIGDQLSPETRTVIDSAPEHDRAALILGSPEMMYR